MRYLNNFLLLFLLTTIITTSFAQTSKHSEKELIARNEIDAGKWKKFEKAANAQEKPAEKTLGLISYGRWMGYSENGANKSVEEVLTEMKKRYKEDALTTRSYGYNMITFSIDGAYHDAASDYGTSETEGTFNIDETGKKLSIDYTFISTLNDKKGERFQLSYDIIHLDGNSLVLAIKGQKLYFHRQ